MEFLLSIWRVAVGTLALGLVAGSMMPLYVTIVARYSMRRMIRGHKGHESSILEFRTQQIPILTSLAQTFVVREFTSWAVNTFKEAELDHRVRHGIATCLKVLAVPHSQDTNLSVSERCGAQGLMSFNQLAPLHV